MRGEVTNRSDKFRKLTHSVFRGSYYVAGGETRRSATIRAGRGDQARLVGS